MAAKFYFHNFEKDESQESFLRSEILGMVEKIIKDGRFMMYVKVSNLSPVAKNPENFSCEVRLDLPTSRKILLKEEGKNFYQTVQSLRDSLKVSVANAM